MSERMIDSKEAFFEAHWHRLQIIAIFAVIFGVYLLDQDRPPALRILGFLLMLFGLGWATIAPIIVVAGLVDKRIDQVEQDVYSKSIGWTREFTTTHFQQKRGF